MLSSYVYSILQLRQANPHDKLNEFGVFFHGSILFVFDYNISPIHFRHIVARTEGCLQN